MVGPITECREGLQRQWTARRGRLAERLTSGPRLPPAAIRDVRLTPGQRLRRDLFERVLHDVEREGFAGLAPATARARLRHLLDEWLADSGLGGMSASERAEMELALLAELTGLGPLDALMADPAVSDILVNSPHDVWVDRFGKLQKTSARFDDAAHMMRILGRIVAAQGRHLEEATPYVDTRLPDGSRLHAMLPPLSANGPVIAIRRARSLPFRIDQLVTCGTMNAAISRFLALAVRGGLHILISGGAATGKTTLLNVLSRFIPPEERVVTIEETAELRLDHPHVVTLEARMANIEGRGEVTLRTLVRNALRMRADRIIVGEVRGAEVFDMLQAMNLGHHGSLTTVHANSCEDALRRLETLVLMGGFDIPGRALRELIGSTLHLVVHMIRLSDGSRRIASVGEVDLQDGEIAVHELFKFSWERDAGGHIVGRHSATGRRPRCLALLRALAADVDGLFEPTGESGA
ncbi:MAG: CpaF family protein [Verrucomicrobia bacterium]|nr:CpaF family protein [Verrucomicrobiota bacterium]MBU1910700.1 CpaF family protein [Verrucomicrobiota bacterium]